MIPAGGFGDVEGVVIFVFIIGVLACFWQVLQLVSSVNWIVAGAVGGRGPNTEYLYNTADHLTELGIADPDLTWLAEKVRNLAKMPG